MAVYVELKLSDISDDPDDSCLRIWTDGTSSPQDVVDAFKTMYTGLTEFADQLDAAEAAASGNGAPATSAASA